MFNCQFNPPILTTWLLHKPLFTVMLHPLYLSTTMYLILVNVWIFTFLRYIDALSTVVSVLKLHKYFFWCSATTNVSLFQPLFFIFSYINRLQVLCKNVIRLGSLWDGGKEICADEPYKPRPPCIVYSFGWDGRVYGFQLYVN